MPKKMNLPKLSLSLAFGILIFLISLALAWGGMLKFNFFYGVWHDYGGIKEGIEKYGPKNRYKNGFADTTKAQREHLFRQIATAIHEGGKGLENISYNSPSSQGDQKLLRRPEIVHLQDVANLLDLLVKLVALVAFNWLVLAGVYLRRFASLPRISEQISGVASLLALMALVLIFAGAENVFNTLHVWVFPDDHQWHFYYQESLMSTMMLAPVLFAWIAGAWLTLSIVCFLLVNMIMSLAMAYWRRFFFLRH